LAPPVILLGAGIISGTLAGAIWASIAAALKVFRGANEIIATIMLNFIAFILITQLTNGPLRDKSATFTTATQEIPTGAKLAPILSGGNITWAILLAAPLCIAVILVLQRTNLGLRLSAIGLNRDAAVHAGVMVPRYWLVSFCISGALGGLAGALVVLGSRFYIAPGWALPWGFVGILIAFLSLTNPFLIPLWSLVFGMLTAAGPTLKASAGVPDAITVMMQTVPVIVLYSLYAVSRFRLTRSWQGATLGRR
jgi:general nucleoside transport system permease protein